MKNKKVNIINAEDAVITLVETDEEEFSDYIRYSADSWSIRMGESIEPLYDCDSLELEYQRYIAERFQEKGAPVGFNYVDITTSGCEGWINLFFGDTCIAMIQDRHVAEQIRFTTKNRRNG